jgi:hypothetical protein
MSAAFGIALERGEIGSIDDFALAYFEDLLPLANTSTQKQQMTLENWLTMQHGLQWNEWDVNYLSNANQNKQMINSATPAMASRITSSLLMVGEANLLWSFLSLKAWLY